MGVSTDATIAFGFDLGEELPGSLEDVEFDELQAKEMGLPAPAVEYSEEAKDIYQKYWEKKRELEKQHPVSLIRHCSGDYPMYFLAVNGTEKTASRGYPIRFEPSLLAVTSEQIAAMQQFCDRHKIDWQEPGWHVFSDWC